MANKYNRNPLLTDATIKIGGSFIYKDKIWYRTDRSVASTFSSEPNDDRANACFFEYPENGGDIQLEEIQKIDMSKLNTLVLKNIDDLIDDTSCNGGER